MVILYFIISLAWALDKPQHCYSLDDVLTEGCRAACMIKGYDKGVSLDGVCNCIDVKSYEDFLHNRVNIKNLKRINDDPPAKVYHFLDPDI